MSHAGALSTSVPTLTAAPTSAAGARNRVVRLEMGGRHQAGKTEGWSKEAAVAGEALSPVLRAPIRADPQDAKTVNVKSETPLRIS